jgi:thioredoxin 1
MIEVPAPVLSIKHPKCVSGRLIFLFVENFLYIRFLCYVRKETPMSRKLLSRDFNTLLETAQKPIVLDFYADWCTPCKMQAPIFTQCEKLLAGKADFYKVNIEEEPELTARFAIVSIPTVLVVCGGEVFYQNIGLTQAEEIIRAVENAIAVK